VRSAAARRPAAARCRRAATAPGRPPGHAPCARSARRALPAAPATARPDAGAPARAHRTTRAARRGPVGPCSLLWRAEALWPGCLGGCLGCWRLGRLMFGAFLLEEGLDAGAG